MNALHLDGGIYGREEMLPPNSTSSYPPSKIGGILEFFYKQEVPVEKSNCWEIMKCGRQKDGENVKNLGLCTAALSSEYDGVNKGKHGGRFCWVITGTLCNGEVQGTYAKKLNSCLDCMFLKQVIEEQGRFFILTPKQAKDNSRHA